MTIKKSFWHTPALFLHVWIVLAAAWTIPPAVIGFQETDCIKYLAVSLILFLPAVSGYYLIRMTKRLWQYALGTIAVIALSGYLTIKLVKLLRICTGEAAAVPSVSRMFEDGVPPAAALYTALGSCLLLSLICMMIRGSVRIKKMQLKKAYEEMEGGSAPILDKADWEFPTFFDSPGIVQWLYYGICYVICALLNAEPCYRMLFWMILTDAVLLLLCTYEDRLYTYIRDHQKIASLPAETMRRVGRIIMRMALLVMLLAVLPAILYGREPLAGVLDRIEEPEPVEINLPMNESSGYVMENQNDDMMEYLEGIEPTELPEWFKQVMRAAAALLVIISFGLIIRGILEGIRQMSAAFSGETEDEVVFLDKSARDEAKALKKTRGDLDGRGTPNAKIRKLYKKMIRKSTKRRPLAAETPTEIEQNSGLTQNEGSRMVHELYEQARYSREGCTGEQAEEMRRTCTNLR